MICFPQEEYYAKIYNLVNLQTNTADSFLEFSNVYVKAPLQRCTSESHHSNFTGKVYSLL